MEASLDFLSSLDVKTRAKVLENIRVSRFKTDPILLKKVDSELWEFRTRFNSKQIRLMAFWDHEIKSLIVCTHGFVKKTQKITLKELIRAKNLRAKYLDSRNRR